MTDRLLLSASEYESDHATQVYARTEEKEKKNCNTNRRLSFFSSALAAIQVVRRIFVMKNILTIMSSSWLVRRVKVSSLD